MPRKFIAGLIVGSLFSASAFYLINNCVRCFSSTAINHYALEQAHSLYQHPKIIISDKTQWTTVSEIEQSLKDTPPMSVGFDIDDTVLFPNTSFHISFQKHCPEDLTPGHRVCMSKQAFWDDLNANGELNPPKEIGKQLVNLHK